MIQDFLTCPKAFYDRHILGKIETTESSALHFGTALHLGLRTMLDGEDGGMAFNMYWDSVKDRHMQYYEHSWKDLRDMANDAFLPNFKSHHLKKFTDFEQEVQMTMPFLDGHTLQGTSDYIGKYDGKLCMADWKTSSKKYKKNKIIINSQLYIYAKMLQTNTGALPEILMYKVFNKKDQSINTIEFQLTQRSLDAIVTIVENGARAMLRTIETKELYHGSDCYCERV